MEKSSLNRPPGILIAVATPQRGIVYINKDYQLWFKLKGERKNGPNTGRRKGDRPGQKV
jgi:hypothetical protein